MSKKESVSLVEYNRQWPEKFAVEKKLIEKTLGSWIWGGVEHVGSTAVESMIAKPVIDIMVGVRSLQEAKICIPILEKIGYLYAPYKSDRMHWFCKPSLEQREYHLYLIEPTHSEWKGRIAFRDYLKKYPNTAQEYVSLKKDLASKFKDDREAYTEGKADFIKTVVEKAFKQN